MEMEDVNIFTASQRREARSVIVHLMSDKLGVLAILQQSPRFGQTLLTLLRFLVGDKKTPNQQELIKRMLNIIHIHAKNLKRAEGEHSLEQLLPYFMKNFLAMLDISSTNRIRIMLLKTISLGTLIAREQMSPYLLYTYRVLHKYLIIDCTEENKHLCNAAFETLYAIVKVSDKSDILLIADQAIAICERVLSRENLPDFIKTSSSDLMEFLAEKVDKKKPTTMLATTTQMDVLESAHDEIHENLMNKQLDNTKRMTITEHIFSLWNATFQLGRNVVQIIFGISS